MRQVRAEIEIRQGEKVGLLFTPRLYMFNGEQGVVLKADTTSMSEMLALYADLIYCAALNLWTLQGNHKGDAPFNRSDFHEFSAVNPREFGKVINIALEALTGKSLEMLTSEAQDKKTKGKKLAENSKKKGLFCRLITRLKHSLSVDAD